MMMGERQVDQGDLFYEFSLEKQVPFDHMLRAIDRFVDLSDVRGPHLTGRPSIDPELLIRMLFIGYCYGIRSERRLCEEVHLNLAYRWFCRLGLAGEVPDHSTFSKNRHGRFRETFYGICLRQCCGRCLEEGLVGGDGFAVDGSLIRADASRQKGVEGCCQSNANQSPRHPKSRRSGRQLTPLGILLPVWQGLELRERGVAVWSGEDGHEATQMEARAESADHARRAEGQTDRRAVRRA